MGLIDRRLDELGIVLPGPAGAAANYVPYVRTGNLLFISGQICFGPDGRIPPEFTGKLGAGVSDEMGRAAARACALNLVAQVKAAVGDLDKVARCVRLGGFMNVMPDYAAIPQIMNGASDVIVDIFGEKGRHARSTVGVAELPFDCVAEVEGLFEVV